MSGECLSANGSRGPARRGRFVEFLNKIARAPRTPKSAVASADVAYAAVRTVRESRRGLVCALPCNNAQRLEANDDDENDADDHHGGDAGGCRDVDDAR